MTTSDVPVRFFHGTRRVIPVGGFVLPSAALGRIAAHHRDLGDEQFAWATDVREVAQAWAITAAGDGEPRVYRVVPDGGFGQRPLAGVKWATAHEYWSSRWRVTGAEPVSPVLSVVRR
jgi:hypothetical protein